MLQGQIVGFVVVLGHDPDVHSFHTTETFRAIPLGLDVEACAVVLVVDVSFHACIIAPIQHYARGLGLFIVLVSACPIRGRVVGGFRVLGTPLGFPSTYT